MHEPEIRRTEALRQAFQALTQLATWTADTGRPPGIPVDVRR